MESKIFRLTRSLVSLFGFSELTVVVYEDAEVYWKGQRCQFLAAVVYHDSHPATSPNFKFYLICRKKYACDDLTPGVVDGVGGGQR